MSEELKQNEIPVENPAPEETEMPAAQEAVALQVAVPTAVTMWNDENKMKQAFKMARFLATSDFIPEQYRNAPQNCIIAIDIANRMGIAPLMVMQNLYIVKGKPTWSGAFCVAAINGSGRFTPLDFVPVYDNGKVVGYYARATRVSTGTVCQTEPITMAMASAEGWLNKPGSKWRTMPEQMMKYRAASFFARTYCPDILQGMPTYEEVQDVKGYTDENQTTVVQLEKQGGEGNG